MGTLSGQKFDQTKYNQVKFNMLKNLKKLINRYGPDAEKVVHGRALKTALNSTNMKENKIREMIHQALSEKKEFPDLTGDGKVTKADILKGRGVKLKEYTEVVDTLALTFKDSNEFERAKEHFESTSDFYPYEINDEFRTFHFEVQDQDDADSTEYYLTQELEGQTDLQGYYFSTESSPSNLDEDIDLGHQDNEPHMLKADLYKIGKYAMELYQIMDDLKNTGQEIDFPHWWQAKIIRAASMVSSAKHYLEFELKEPQVDAMVGAASSEDVIDEKLTAKTPMKKYIKDFAKSDAPMMEGEIDKADILSGELYKLKGKIQDAFFDKIRKFINMGSYEDAEYLLNRVKGQMKEKAVAAKLSTENPTEGLAEIILNKLKNR
jgi:hypothetical protein